MATYFILETSTRDGAMSVKSAPERSKGVVASGEKMGVRIIEWFYAIGPFDFIMKAEAPDDETMAAFIIAINAGGNVTAKYYRVYTPQAWTALVGRLA